jgi:hypothetical protein
MTHTITTDPVATAERFASELTRETVTVLVAGLILGAGVVAMIAMWWLA